MLIDFHCHTKATKKGEDNKRNIKPGDFKKAIVNAQIKIVAITNHNEFIKEEYELFSKEAGDDFIVLPGIELDVDGLDGERGHVVVIYDDQDVNNFDTMINSIIKGVSPDKFSISIDSLIRLINDLNCIVLAHYCKPDSLHQSSIDSIKERITDKYRFFYEPSSYRTLGIMINNNFRALKGSDIVDWDNYTEQEFANIKLDIDSYKNLMLFIKKDTTIIESLLNKQTKYKVDISYSGPKEIVELYNNINILFGTKGTGKTVSLEKIKDYFIKIGKDVKFYSPDKTTEKIQEKLKISEEEKKFSFYGKENKSELFSDIFSWEEPEVTQFIEYYHYVKYTGKNKNKEKMNILKINQLLDYDSNIIKGVRTDYNSLTSIKSTLNKINISKYLKPDDIANLNNSLDILSKAIINSYSIEFDNCKGTSFANKCIDQIKKAVEKNTETKTVPTGTRFKEFAKSLFKLEHNLNEIIRQFDFCFESELEYVGTLEEGKKLFKKTKVIMLKEHSKAEDGFNQITKIKSFRKKIFDLKENIYTNNLLDSLNGYKEEYELFDNVSLDDFIGIKKQFVLNGDSYVPSTGESTMILLDDSLDDSHDVYILDEPEKSLGNNYISEVLVPKLNDLSKLKKVIVIATHNANIAVRTFPYCSILKTYFNGEYKTYIGNPYTNRLINIHNKDEYKSWKDESISILEGGREAFNERSDIYD